MVDANDPILFYMVFKAHLDWGKLPPPQSRKVVVPAVDPGTPGRSPVDGSDPNDVEPTYKVVLVAELSPDSLRGLRNIKANQAMQEVKFFMTSGFEAPTRSVLQNKLVQALTPGLTGPVETVMDPIFLSVCDAADKLSFGTLEFSEVLLKFTERREKKLPTPVLWASEMATSEVKKRNFGGKFYETAKGLIYEDDKVQTGFGLAEGSSLILMLKDTNTHPDLSLLFNASRTDLYIACLESAHECVKLKKDLEKKTNEAAQNKGDGSMKEVNLRNQIAELGQKLKAVLLEKEIIRQKRDELEITNTALQGEMSRIADVIEGNDKSLLNLLPHFESTLNEAFPNDWD